MYEIIEIKKSPTHGKGVFAKVNIHRDTEMVCDILSFNSDTQTLKDYHYPWKFKDSSICIGFGSYFNHSIKPNVKIFKIDRESLTKTFITLSDIEAGEELSIYYGDDKIF